MSHYSDPGELDAAYDWLEETRRKRRDGLRVVLSAPGAKGSWLDEQYANFWYMFAWMAGRPGWNGSRS